MENTTPTEQIQEVSTPETVQEVVQTPQEVAPQPEVKAEEPIQPIEFKPFEIPVETPQDPLADLTEDKVAERFKGKEEALLKALGLDDFALGAINYYRQTGSLAEYAEVKSVDYSKLPDQSIVERKLREQYASQGLSEEEARLLIEDEMADRYKLDAERFSEREQLIGKARMKADANTYRSEFIDRQQKFRAPEKAPQAEAQPQMTPEQEVAMYRDAMLQDQSIQKLVKEKKVQFGDPSSPYNYEVKPEEVVQLLSDKNYYNYHVALKNAEGKVIKDKDGNLMPDYARLQKIAIYAKNMDEIERQLISYGKSLGTKQVITEAENPLDNASHGATPEVDDLYTALNRKLTAR